MNDPGYYVALHPPWDRDIGPPFDFPHPVAPARLPGLCRLNQTLNTHLVTKE